MGEYDDIVANVRRTTEAAVNESQERVELAMRRGEQADREATEASQAFGTRWANRINAMRRRAAEQAKSTELRLGHEEGPHPNDHTDADDLVSLTEPAPPRVPAPPDGPPPPDVPTPPYGISGDLFDEPPCTPPAPPPPPVYEDEDYSNQTWLRDR